jgi:hypothetical protein
MESLFGDANCKVSKYLCKCRSGMTYYAFRFSVLTAMIMLLVLSLVLIDVKAQPVLGLAWASTPPIIDGVFSPGEWNNADSETFTLGSASAIIYVMNDENNLYIAVKIQDDDVEVDDLAIQFDNDNSGGTLVKGDDSLVWWGSFFDTHFNLPTATDLDTSDGGTNDGSGALTQDGLMIWYYEFSHPLDSSDDVHDFSLSLGSTVGFELSWKDRKKDQPSSFYSWPAATWTDPNSYGDIILARTAYQPVGGVIKSANKFEMLIPYITLAGLIVAVSTVYIIKRRKD